MNYRWPSKIGICFLFLISTWSCNQDDDAGNETFISANIAGQDFEASGELVTGSLQLMDDGGQTLFVGGVNFDRTSMSIVINSQTVLETGIYEISAESQEYTSGTVSVAVGIDDDLSYTTGFEPEEPLGFIEITNLNDSLIEGDFEFTALLQDDDSQIIEVTDGKFAVRRP